MFRRAVPFDVLHANDAPGSQPPSWYHATAPDIEEQPPLTASEQCQIAIVGAGYTGLSAALHLARSGFDVTVLEANRIGWGASGRNGGQVSGGQRLAPEKLEAMLGKAEARWLWELGGAAKKLVRSLIAENAIECDPVAGIIHADHRQRFVADSRRHVQKMNEEYGYAPLRFLGREEMRALVGSPAYHGGTHDGDAFHIHPLKYARGMAQAALRAGARIHEASEVVEWRHGNVIGVKTARGELQAEQLILACNGYLGMLDRQVAARVMPINNFIIATEPLGEERAKALISDNSAVDDSRFVINYFRRSADHRLLFGGGETYGYRFPGDIACFVRRPMSAIFPQLAKVKIDFAWGGTLAITRTRLPHFARLAQNCRSVSGYSGQGIALATMAGRLVADSICGRNDPFDRLCALTTPPFPGGVRLRSPLLALAMRWYSLRDRI